MRIAAASFALFLSFAIPLASSQQVAKSEPATVAEARAFVDRANANLLKLNIEASHADWTAKTDITEDTEATTALLTERLDAHNLELITESHRFDHLQLPPDLRRQIMLLQVTAPAAPKDPKLLAEQSELAAQLTGMYGKGKYCPDTPAGHAPAPV